MEEYACRAENPGPNERKGVIRPSAPERPEGESQDQGKKGQSGQGMRDAPVQGQKKFRRAAEEGIDVRGGCGEHAPGCGRAEHQLGEEQDQRRRKQIFYPKFIQNSNNFSYLCRHVGKNA